MLASRTFTSIRSIRPTLILARAMATSQPNEGSTLTGTFKVQESDLASATSPDPSDSYARVLATPRVIGFMEIVSARMLVPHLAPGQMSVGVTVNMQHLAATPVDEEVSVTAKFLKKEGKLFQFEVVATDAGGEIGKARHDRALIDEERLMSGAKKRIAGGSKM